MDVEHLGYVAKNWSFEDDRSLRNARLVLKEAEEWQETLMNGFSILRHERETRDVYEVLNALGKDGLDIQNVRIKQLVRERIKTLEPDVKTIEGSRKERHYPPRTKPPEASGKQVKLVPTPLPRVAFLSRRNTCSKENRESATLSRTNVMAHSSKTRNVTWKPENPTRLLSQLLERPRKLPLLSDFSHGLPPIADYFCTSLSSTSRLIPAHPVLPSCEVLQRNTQEKHVKIKMQKMSPKREDRIAVTSVESKHHKRKPKEKLQIQVLPSVCIDSKLQRRRQSNTRLISLVLNEERNGSPDISAKYNESLDTRAVADSSKGIKFVQKDSDETGHTVVPSSHSFSVPQKHLASVDGCTQTNSNNGFQKGLENDHLRHFIQQVVEEGLAARLKAIKTSDQETSTETQIQHESDNDLERNVTILTKDMDIQTDFIVQSVDKETSSSELLREVKDAEIWTEVKTANAEVQMDKVESISVALSPIQELKLQGICSKEVEARPDLVDCATSPALVESHEGQPGSSDLQSPTPNQPKKLGTRPTRLQESSGSSYLTDTTSSTTATTTTTTSDEQMSEGELLIRRRFEQVTHLPSLSEGEILPEMLHSGSRDDLNSSRSEGQLEDLNSTRVSQSTGISGTPDGEQALQSTGEISIRPLSTDPSASS